MEYKDYQDFYYIFCSDTQTSVSIADQYLEKYKDEEVVTCSRNNFNSNKTNAELISKNNDLKKDVGGLELKNKKLIEENETMKKTIKSYDEKIKTKDETINKYITSIDKFVRSTEKLIKENETIKNKLVSSTKTCSEKIKSKDTLINNFISLNDKIIKEIEDFKGNNRIVLSKIDNIEVVGNRLTGPYGRDKMFVLTSLSEMQNKYEDLQKQIASYQERLDLYPKLDSVYIEKPTAPPAYEMIDQ